MAKEYQITNLPLSVLNISIAYGFNVATSVKGDYEEECVYNKEFFNLMWRVYTETEKDIDGYRRYELLAAENVRMSGYIKMDYFYNKHIYSEDIMCKLWKIPKGRASEEYISFICEYMYVNKPMLFLRREEQRLTELGNMAVESQYNAGGRDYMAIDKFISEVVISGKDYKKAERERVFEQELDYVRINGRNSAEYVYGDIVNSLGLRISSE